MSSAVLENSFNGSVKTKPYRYLEVQEKVPRFRDFINGLNAETKRRIEKIVA